MPPLGYVPWPIPAAAGLAIGIAAHGAGRGAVLAACLAAALAAVALARVAAGVPRRRRAAWLVWLALPLCVPLGWGRDAQRAGRPQPLAAAIGRTLEVEGHSDARFLTLPGVRERFALSPAGSVPVGRVRLRGEAVAPSGRRNPGDFAYDAWLRRRDVPAQLRVDAVLEATPATGVRARLHRGVVRGLDGERAALLEAMTLGVRDGLGPLRDRFARAGLAHLLALSGLHLGLLAAVAAWAFRPLGVARAPALALLVIGFLVLVGATPSLLRAAAMTLAALATSAAGLGRVHPATALGLAAVVTLLARPDWLTDTGFVLSYASLLGLLAYAAPLAARVRPPPGASARGRVGAWVGQGLIASLAATVPTLSIVAGTFGAVPLFGALVNLPAMPLAAALVPLGFAAALLGAIAPPLAALPNAVAGPVAAALLALADAGARLPAAPWSEIGAVGHAYFALGAAPWALVVRRRLAPRRALAVSVAALAGCLAAPAAHPVPELVVLDVGQGDAALLRLPGRVEILVDGGGSPFSDFDVGANVVVPALRAMDVDELELVLATHADADHMEGLAAVVRAVPTLQIAYGLEAPARPVWRALMARAEAEGVSVRALRRGHRVRVGEAELYVLHPPAGTDRRGNEASLAVAVWWRQRPWALLLGDVGAEVEADLPVPPSPVLLAPHHGSGGSGSRALLRAARPDTVVVSVGTNAYGHPAPAALRRFEAAGATVLRTDRLGAVRLRPGW